MDDIIGSPGGVPMPTPFGKYHLLRKLAEGGMAEVFLARQDGASDRVLVIKRILPHLNELPEFVRMFINEARIAARLHHPNVAQIFDLGRVGHSHFMAMEYVHGEDLAQIAKRSDKLGRGAIPLGNLVRIGADLCAGLGYAHAARDQAGRPLGIVHRDVSPQNVLATFEGTVKVIDFGIAKATAEASETRAGFMKGKYAYMSPEQCKGEPVNAQSDVYSIGIMLWEFASWRRLFKRDADFLTMRAVVEDEVPPASAFRREVPRELDAILWKALARDRRQRYASCLELAADLEDVGRRMRWDISAAGSSRLMCELFADRLAAQQNALREAQVERIEEFLLNADEATTIDWMERESNEDVAQSFTFGQQAQPQPQARAQRISQPVPVQRISQPVPAQRISQPVPVQRISQPVPAQRVTPAPMPAQRPRDETSVTDPQRPAAPGRPSILFWPLVLLLAAAAAVVAYLIVNRTLR